MGCWDKRPTQSKNNIYSVLRALTWRFKGKKHEIFLSNLYVCMPFIFKPIFHRKLRLRRLPNANEINTKNMKCTCPTQRPNTRDPTQPIFHWLTLGFGVGGNANLKLCVGSKLVSPTKFWRLGHCPTPTPDARYFALQWNIGLTLKNSDLSFELGLPD